MEFLKLTPVFHQMRWSSESFAISSTLFESMICTSTPISQSRKSTKLLKWNKSVVNESHLKYLCRMYFDVIEMRIHFFSISIMNYHWRVVSVTIPVKCRLNDLMIYQWKQSSEAKIQMMIKNLWLQCCLFSTKYRTPWIVLVLQNSMEYSLNFYIENKNDKKFISERIKKKCCLI